MNGLACCNLAIGYPERSIAAGLNAVLAPGELTCLIGPNGAGKSTLLRTLAGMQRPQAGSVQLDGSDMHRLSARERAKVLAVVLTERVDAGNLTAYTVVALGRFPHTNWRGQLSDNDRECIETALARVGASQFAARPLAELSDGERQKVMIARALAQSPQVLLLDEPTAFLDLPRRVEITMLLHRIAHDTGCIILLTTHDLDLALRIADRIWLLPAGGQLHTGLPEELALDGSLERAFESEGITYDAAQGRFNLQRKPCGPISLQGIGLRAVWTQRALERVGYDVLPAPARTATQVTLTADAWQIDTNNTRTDHTTLAGLIAHVTRLPGNN